MPMSVVIFPLFPLRPPPSPRSLVISIFEFHIFIFCERQRKQKKDVCLITRGNLRENEANYGGELVLAPPLLPRPPTVGHRVL